jgi:nitrite reductase/ring-hydroxylating ferredoxin subunit
MQQQVDLSLENTSFMEPLRVEHDGVAVMVVQTENGIYAYEDRCPHAFWPISEGEVNSGILECPGHGWTFDVKTGKCLNAPAYCLKRISVIIHGDIIRLAWEAEPSIPMEKASGPSSCPARPIVPILSAKPEH